MARRLTLEEVQLQSMVKRANQRLRELEKQGYKSSAYKSIISKTYGRDKAKYLGTTNKGEVKFRTDITKMRKDTLRALRENVEKFLSSQGSTVRGIKRTTEKQRRTYNERYGTNISSQSWVEMWTSAQARVYEEQFGYDKLIQVVDDLGKANIKDDEIMEAIFKSEKLIGEQRVLLDKYSKNKISKNDFLNALKG